MKPSGAELNIYLEEGENEMSLFSRVTPLVNGAGFTRGAPPKGILVGSSSEAHVNDMYGTGFTLAGNSAGSEIFPIRISEAITVSGTVYVLY